MTHTPGPWYVTASAPEGCVFGGPDHRLIVPSVEPENQPPQWNSSEDWANRRLIVAAPALLTALTWFADELPSIIRQCCPNGVPISVAAAHDSARAAIALATGDTQ